MESQGAGQERRKLRARREGRMLPVGGWLGVMECFCTRDSGTTGGWGSRRGMRRLEYDRIR